MLKAADVLLRRVAVNGNTVPDCRLVVTHDQRAVLIARPNGQPVAIATMLDATYTIGGSGQISVSDGENSWTAQRDTRCGSCGGRYELRALDPSPLLPPSPLPPVSDVEQTAEGTGVEMVPVEGDTLAATGYGDTY